MFAALVLVFGGCSDTTSVETDFRFSDAMPEKKSGDESSVIIGPVSDLDVQAPPIDGLGLDSFVEQRGKDVDADLADTELPEPSDATEQIDLPDDPDLEDALDADTPDPVEIVPEVEVPDVQKPDNSCNPQCGAKECGSDGCDGVCGYCAYGFVCDPDGNCVADICPKQCTATVEGDEVDKDCGPDGCGGSCGYCVAEGMICGDDGFCYAGSCESNCKNKVCGPDGCGGSCGFCQFGELCDEDSNCVPHPCGTVTYKGKCDDNYNLIQCIDLELQQTNCKTFPDKMCGWDENVGKYDCVPETECEPDCTFGDGTQKECGPDGCWGSCGICPKGWGCGAGWCSPAEGAECAWIDNMTGACVEHTKWFCSVGLLYGYDCMAKEGKTCGWNHKANFGLGGYDCIDVL